MKEQEVSKVPCDGNIAEKKTTSVALRFHGSNCTCNKY